MKLGKEEKKWSLRSCTLLGVPSCVRLCQQKFGQFPRLVGRYCSYLLPMQAGGIPETFVDKTSRMTGRLRVYITLYIL